MTDRRIYHLMLVPLTHVLLRLREEFEEAFGAPPDTLLLTSNDFYRVSSLPRHVGFERVGDGVGRIAGMRAVLSDRESSCMIIAEAPK